MLRPRRPTEGPQIGPPLRVLHLASGDSWAGAEQVLFNLVRGALERRDLEVEVLLFNEGSLTERLRRIDAKLHVIPETNHSFRTLVGSVRQCVAGGRFDVLQAHRYKEILLASLVAAGPQRIVVTVHGLEPRFSLSQAVRIWGPLHLARCRGAHFTAVSKELARRLRRWLGAGRVHQIPNPLYEPARHPEAPDLRRKFEWEPGRPIIGFVGRLARVKGPDRFVDLAARMPPRCGFVVIGSGPMQVRLERRVTSLALTDRVRFLGEVPDASGYLKQMDLLALTSRHEGMPMVLLEATQSEVPIVAFDVGGVREILDGGPAARLVPAGDVAAMAAAACETIDDPRTAKEACGRRLEQLRARHGLASVVQAYVDLYSAR